MPGILSESDYLAARKQRVTLTKTQAATSVAAQLHTLWDRAGNPGAASLAVGNTTNGLIPTDATTGAPSINDFAAGAYGYVSAVLFSSTVACRLELFDRLFHVGSISLTALATTTLSAQPSYAARVTLYDPITDASAVDYKGLRIFVEINTTVSATATTVSVSYTNQAGTSGRTAGPTASLSGFVTGRLVELPLQAGDTGVQQINSVTVGGTVATAGTFNLIVARPLWQGRVRSANDGDANGWAQVGFAQVFQDSCLWLVCAADSTSTGAPDLAVELASK